MKNFKKLSLASLILATSACSFNAYALTMNGRCEITHQNLAGLTCNGPAEIKDATISGDVTINGPANFDHVKIKGTLTVHGPANIKNGPSVTVTTQISGPLKVENSKLAQIEINGSLKAEDSVIQGTTEIHGDLEAEHSVFNGEINAAANYVELEKSKVNGDLTITSNEPPSIKLKDSSIVNGKVIFKDTSGTVLSSDKNSTVKKVENGSIITKS